MSTGRASDCNDATLRLLSAPGGRSGHEKGFSAIDNREIQGCSMLDGSPSLCRCTIEAPDRSV